MNTQQQAATGDRYVNSDEEFRSAIGEIAKQFNTVGDIDGAVGGRIVIASSWETDGYFIPPECAGTLITALPGCRLSAKSGPGTVTLFSVQAADVEISKVTAVYGSYAFAAFCSAEVGTLDGVSVSANRLTVEKCVISSARTYYDNSGGLAVQAKISRNHHIATGKSDAVYIDSDLCIVDGNVLLAFSTLFSIITVAANGARCRIVNNDVNHGKIVTSASGGENVIACNVNTFTITSHATDAVGLNT